MSSPNNSPSSERHEQSSRRNNRTQKVRSEKQEPRRHHRRHTSNPNENNKVEIESNDVPTPIRRVHRNNEHSKNIKNTMDPEEWERTHRRRGPDPVSPVVGDGTSELEFRQKSKILEVLNAFKDDVVTVKSSQRNAWQEKLDALQQQRCSSQLSLYPNSSMQGLRAPEEKVHEIVDTKRASTTSVRSERDAEIKRKFSEPEPLETREACGDLIQKICHYSSGLLSGILLWQTLFGVLLFREMSASYWLLYWSFTTILVLITVVGFLNRICMSPEDVHDFDIGQLFLHVIPSLILLIFHYINKALSLQHRECSDYLKITNEAEKSRIYLSYACQGDPQQKSTAVTSTDATRIILTIFPTLTALGIYTYLHLSRNERSSGSYRQYSESV